MFFNIEKSLFEYFPGLKIVVAVARGLEETPEKEAIEKRLYIAWQSAREAASEYGNPQSHPFIKAWGEALRQVNAPRKKFPSSIEALVRRAGKSETPVTINPLVDFYNSVSLANLVPAGGFDLDSLKNNVELRFSREGDTFLALDSEEPVAVEPGEVGYTDGNNVITRHFVWKQSTHAILLPESKNIVLVSEILGELPQEVVTNVAQGFKEGLKHYFKVEPIITILKDSHCSVEL